MIMFVDAALFDGDDVSMMMKLYSVKNVVVAVVEHVVDDSVIEHFVVDEFVVVVVVIMEEFAVVRVLMSVVALFV